MAKTLSAPAPPAPPASETIKAEWDAARVRIDQISADLAVVEEFLTTDHSPKEADLINRTKEAILGGTTAPEVHVEDLPGKVYAAKVKKLALLEALAEQRHRARELENRFAGQLARELVPTHRQAVRQLLVTLQAAEKALDAEQAIKGRFHSVGTVPRPPYLPVALSPNLKQAVKEAAALVAEVDNSYSRG